MPPFYKHRSDPSPGEISYPWRKIDEDQLRHYISGKPLPDWQCQAHYQCHRLTTSRNVATASLTFHSLLVKTLAKLRANSSDWNCWNILLGWRCWPMIRKRRVWYRNIWTVPRETRLHWSMIRLWVIHLCFSCGQPTGCAQLRSVVCYIGLTV